MGKTKTRPLSTEERKARLEEVAAKLEAGVRRITDTEEFREYLRFMGNFHSYSANNVLLIHIQNQEATMVAGFHDWKKRRRSVCKGEKAIKILAPMTGKARDEITGEEKSQVFGFRAVSVFDISQTEGEPIPEAPDPQDLAGSSEGVETLYRSLISVAEAQGVRCFDQGGEEFHGQDGLKGFYDRTNRMIKLRFGLSPNQRAKTMCHELAHHFLHREDRKYLTRETAELCRYPEVGQDRVRRAFGLPAPPSPA